MGGEMDLDWGATKLSGEENCDFGLDGGVSWQMGKINKSTGLFMRNKNIYDSF